jgi:hypothetical protein
MPGPIPLSNLHCTHCSTFSNINKTIYTYYNRLHLEAFASANNKTLKDILYYARAFSENSIYTRLLWRRSFSRYRIHIIITLWFSFPFAHIFRVPPTSTEKTLASFYQHEYSRGIESFLEYKMLLLLLWLLKFYRVFLNIDGARRVLRIVRDQRNGSRWDTWKISHKRPKRAWTIRYLYHKYRLRRRRWTLYCVTRAYICTRICTCTRPRCIRGDVV